MPNHYSFGLHRLILKFQVLNEITYHLLEASNQIFNSIQCKEFLLVLVFVQISAQEVLNSFLHNSFFHFRKVISVEVEVFDQLLCCLTVAICGELLDKLNLEIFIMINKHFCCLELIIINQLHHDK